MKLLKSLIAAVAFAVAILSASPKVCAQSDSKFYVSATGGYSACLNGFTGPYDSGEPRLGGDWGINLGWVSRSKIGAGLSYSGYTSTARRTLFLAGGFLKLDMRYLLNYVAPQFIFQTDFGKSKWFFNTSAGAGALIFTEKGSYSEKNLKLSDSESKSSFAFNVYAGFGYSITPHFAIIANFGYTHGCMRIIYESGSHTDKCDYISRINLDFGLKYTF